MERLTVSQLMDRLAGPLGLTLVTALTESAADITVADVSRPGLFLTGFEEGFRSDRVQLLGEGELSYLDSLDEAERRHALERLCTASVPCVIVSGGREAPPELVELANACGVPVLASAHASERLVRDLSAFLDDLLAPSATVHGTLVDVYGVGLLFTGKSGIGKSECGLDLVEHGHRLVADDVVHVVRTRQGNLVGSGNELLRHYMEIRGVGIIDVRSMFGIRAIRQRKRIEVQVQLVQWSDLDDYERLGVEERTSEILEVEIPHVTLPLVPGKNITVISEIIALNHLLKLRGVHPAREFDSRLRDLVSEKSQAQQIIRGDDE
jgi:HPr kinase/phosphorylase